MMLPETIAKAKNVWESPLNGNAVVILREISENPISVTVGDLDMGEEYDVELSHLTKKIREVEEEDYGYSWCADHDDDIWDYVFSSETVPDNRQQKEFR